ncbi:hypothetical protein DL98DRAFT_593956 [Cadophora sp. DSE1049]|nr:hypothetical protein DL98DRAFT_593956 [Cadophora sp. DSE1049]
MDGSKRPGESPQDQQTRSSTSRKQGNAREPKKSTPPEDPPFTFYIDGSSRLQTNGNIPARIGNIPRQEAAHTQTSPSESVSMGFQSAIGYARPGPTPQQGYHPLDYTGHPLSPPSLGYSSQDPASSAPSGPQASLSPSSFQAFLDRNPNDRNRYLSCPAGPYSQQAQSSIPGGAPSTDRSLYLTSPTHQYPRQRPLHPGGALANVRNPHLPSPAPSYPQQTSSDQGFLQSPFGNTEDFATRDMLLPHDLNENQPSNAPQNLSFPEIPATVSPPAAPQPRLQPFSARNPTPPPGYMFGSPADLQAAVNIDPQRVFNYIRRLNRENVGLQERLGRSRQQTKDEEDRDKRHVTIMERAWEKLSAALAQVHPALASGPDPGPAVQGSGGAQASGQTSGPGQASNPVPGRGRVIARGRGAGRRRGVGRGNKTGRGQRAAPNRPTGADTRKGKGANKTQAVDEDDTEGEDGNGDDF